MVAQGFRSEDHELIELLNKTLNPHLLCCNLLKRQLREVILTIYGLKLKYTKAGSEEFKYKCVAAKKNNITNNRISAVYQVFVPVYEGKHCLELQSSSVVLI